MQCPDEQIRELIDMLWGTVLSLDLQHQPQAQPPANHERTLAASVQITGDWEGAVALFCPAPLAREISTIMFDSPETSDELIQDAMGELANIIAGGIKALLPGECLLSLPTVADGTVFTLRVRGSRVVSEVGFESRGHPFTVSLLTHDESGELSNQREGSVE